LSEPTGFEKLGYVPDLAHVLEAHAMTDQEIFLDLRLSDGRRLDHVPGQFVQVSLLGVGEVPISICSSPTRGDTFQLCIREAGIVTHALRRTNESARLGIRGPFGKGFPLSEMMGRDLVLVAGGLGIAPMRSLITYVLDRREEFGRLMVVYGTRNPRTLLFEDDLADWRKRGDIDLTVTVDRGDENWKGRTGVATEPLAELNIRVGDTVAVVIGPPVLFRFAAVVLFEQGLTPESIFFSLERNFHCGIGKCGHCQLNDLYVCQDGPVFRLARILDRIEAVEAWSPEEDQDR
jgi:NAD(P)H-flavin reductase